MDKKECLRITRRHDVMQPNTKANAQHATYAHHVICDAKMKMSSVIKILLILALLQVLACKNETGVVNKKDIIPRNENVCNDEKLEDYKSLSIIELDEQKMKILKSNTRLPEIRIFTIGTGRLGLLEDYLNSDFTIINLWSSSCQTSTKNISSLKELWEKYNSDGLNIVTLSIDQGENSFSELENLRSDNEVKWPTMLLDDGIQSSLCEQLNIKNIPQIIILNKEYKATKTDYPYTLNDNLDKLISSLISDNKKK